MGNCWDCEYLIDWTGTNWIQDFKCNWFLIHKNLPPKCILPKKDLDIVCNLWKKRVKDSKIEENNEEY